MPQLYIYRVETPTGLGPWCDEVGDWSGGAGTEWCSGAVSLHSHAHSYLDLQKKRKNNKYRFGFLSLHQLFKYMTNGEFEDDFTYRFKSMVKASLVINVYRVYHGYVLADETQCIFQLDRNELVQSLHPLCDFVRQELNHYLSFEERLRNA